MTGHSELILAAAVAVLGVASLLPAAAFAQSNGSFETGDFTDWSVSNTNYADVVTEADGLNKNSTTPGYWTPTDGGMFALIESGERPGIDTTVSRQFSMSNGGTVSFDVFFDTQDHGQFDNNGFVELTNVDTGNTTILYAQSVATVGDYGEDGWTAISHQVSQPATYELRAGVRNFNSNGFLSELGLDDVEVQHAPVAQPDSATTDEDTPVSVDVLSNDTDFDADALEDDGVTQPDNGTATDNDSDVTYTPDPDFNGTDSFTYTVSDGNGGTDTATVDITVDAVNDAPFFTSSPVTDATQDQSYGYIATADDADAGDALTVSANTLPSWLTLSDNGDGTAALTGTPLNEDVGSHPVELVVTDFAGATDTQSFTIDVENTNDAPEFIDPTPEDQAVLSVAEGETMEFELEATDDDGDTLTYLVDPLFGAAAFDETTGEFGWSPTWEDAGTYALTLTASDGQSEVSREITVEVTFTDDDGDGLPDSWEDENGLDSTSADSDGDGISDADEVGDNLEDPRDTDKDGTVDALDDDSDGDGISDADEAGDDDLSTPPVDSDGDGTPDYRQVDSDGDEVDDGDDNCPTVDNPEQSDLDDDGIGDACDDDIDGDGIANDTEEEYGLDPEDPDTDGDTISDGDEFYGEGDDAPVDTDDDGTIDALDDDSDDDGIPDADEAGDEDLSTPPTDTDDDGVADFRSTDADGDGIEDDEDNCLLVDNPDQTDTDDDGTGDACDGDADGDGADDEDDNCPLVQNPEQADLDEDGTGDECDSDVDGDDVDNNDDNCPMTANEDQADLDDDGIGDECDADVDGDGIENDDDVCPMTADEEQVDADGDGIGDACVDDNDGDGIDDDDDVCPDTADPRQTDTDGDGVGDACDDDIDGDGIVNDEDDDTDGETTATNSVTEEGCGCSASDGPTGGAGLVVFLAGLLGIRLRRRTQWKS